MLQGFANDVFDAAYNITTHADSALVIFDDLVVILNVDVNVSGMNSDVAVSCFCFAMKVTVSKTSAPTSQSTQEGVAAPHVMIQIAWHRA